MAFSLANYIRFQELWHDGNSYPSLLIVVNITAMFCHFLSQQNQINASYSFKNLLFNTLEYIAVIAFFVLFYWFLIHDLLYSRIHIAAFFVFSFILFLYAKYYYVRVLRSFNIEHLNKENSIVIGTSIYSKKFTNNLLKNKWTGYHFIGYVNQTGEGAQVIGKFTDIEELCKQYGIKNIFINIQDIQIGEKEHGLLREISERNLIKVMILSELHHQALKSSYHSLIGEFPVVYLFVLPLDGMKNKLIKRLFDIFFSIFIIVFVFSWLFPIIFILIKLESKGPIFYAQKRQGKDNKIFWCFKFRTMIHAPNAVFTQAVKNDSRITKVGQFLRKSNIDELPQFFNVLKGDMAVVGPRPHAIEHNIEFADRIEKFYSRHLFKPGVTGLAQVRGYRGEITSPFKMSGRVKLDRYYLYNWTFGFDLKIIWWTIRNILIGDPNAY